MAVLLFFLLVLKPLNSLQQPHDFKIWIDYPSKELTEMGEIFMQRGYPDSALVCYSIVAGRYSKDLSVSEQKVCRNAYFNRWLIYFNKMYDFSKAYENLTKADEISKNIGDTDPNIELAFAYFYETMEDNIQDNTNRLKNIHHCHRAFYSALKHKKSDVMDRAFVNYITSAYKYGIFSDESAKMYKDYADFKDATEPFFKEFNLNLYKLYEFILKNNYEEALKLSDRMKRRISEVDYADKFLYIVQCVKFDIYTRKGEYTDALKCMEVVQEILLRNPNINKRTTLEIYKDIYTCYQKMGETNAYKENLNKYLLLKESLLNMKQVTRMNEIAFLGEIAKMDENLAMMREKARTQNVFFLLMSVIILIIVLSVFLLYRKNKHLAETNMKLYENFNELVRAKDREIEGMLAKGMSDKKDVSDASTIKYKDSSLKADDKDEILARILKVMDNVDEICSNDFSAERLAKLTATSYKNVSQVINEKFECNFNVFLNRYRIEEACHRLSDTDKYGMYTIEAISESVGFKSRTRFASNFKKEVGMSPSEYRNISIKRSTKV